ncbi:MAG TPA: BadF/BadG/BcrA/BcrD ATPase family protein [Bacillales bacterium]
MQSNKYFIGIDGGGTKTSGVIGDEHGVIKAKLQGKSSNIQSKPANKVKEVLLQLIRDLTAGEGIKVEQIETIYFSMAGCGRPQDKRRILELLRPDIDSSIDLIVENDAMGALAAGTWGEPGIVLIAGTGSIAYVYSPINGISRVGGWGYLLGDEGSGFEIGRKGLAAVLKQYDGRGKETELTEILLNRYNLSFPEQLIPLIYNAEDVRGEIASVTEAVFKADYGGDPVAIDITRHAVAELVDLIRTAQKTGETANFPLVISGGLFKNKHFKSQFVQAVKHQLGEVLVIEPSVSPEAGAFILALKHSGFEISTEKKESILGSWTRIEERGV